MSFYDSFTAIVRGDLSKPMPKKNTCSSSLSPSKTFTTEQYQLYLKYARISELQSDVVLDDTLSKISREL